MRAKRSWVVVWLLLSPGTFASVGLGVDDAR
jgi:hypothetical protein